MRKLHRSWIALLMAITMLVTNVTYVDATDVSVNNIEGKMISEELIAQLLAEKEIPYIEEIQNIKNNINTATNVNTSENNSDGNDNTTNDGNDLGTGDGTDIPTGDHILYSGKKDGLIWYIDKDKVLTITGTNTNESVEPGEEDTIFTIAPWMEYYGEFTKVVITAKNVKTTYMWFILNEYIEEVDMSGWDTSTVENMSFMFFGCTGLKSMDLSNWNTSNVKYMCATFAGCTSLTSLNLSGLNTSAVKDMSLLFFSCMGLTSLDVSGLDTSAVEDMSYMFAGCTSLTSLDVSKLNTSAVKNMESMFYYCSGLKSINLSGINTSNVETMGDMFSDCTALTSLDVSKFDISKLTNANDMFYNCTSLESIQSFRKLQIDIELPVSPMFDVDNNIYEDYFPRGLENSVNLLKTSPMEGKLWVAEVAPQTYTGKAIKPAIKVYEGPYLLKEKVDYTVSYKNNVKVNDAKDAKTAPTIIVKGKGNYTGKETVTFQILPIDFQDEKIVAKDIYASVNSEEQKPVPTVTYKNKKLKYQKDFTVDYSDKSTGAYKEEGTYTIKVTGIGNYSGSRDIAFTITSKNLITNAKVASIPTQTYSGSPIEPELKISYKGTPLTKDTDYIVTYDNNTYTGKATAKITGTGNYAGTKEVTFKITGPSIAKATVNGIENKVYNGTAQTQTLAVTLNGTPLTEGTDYDVTYNKNINAGTASIVLTGKGKYSGTLKKSFKIAPYNIAKDEQDMITGISNTMSREYVKGGVTPEISPRFNGIKMTAKKDFTVTYKNNKKVTTSRQPGSIVIKGKGNFTGTRTTKLYISRRSLDDYFDPITVVVPDVAHSDKPGKFASKPVLIDTNGKKLTAGTDYDKNFIYTLEDGTRLDKTKDAPPVGTVITIHIIGKGNYTGIARASYKITEKSFNSAIITVKPQAYTGKAVTLDSDDITVMIDGKELTLGEGYEIVEGTYINNIKKGTASVSIRGLGEYGGTKTVKFKIASRNFIWFWNLLG